MKRFENFEGIGAKCPRCNATFGGVQGMYCKSCTEIIRQVKRLEQQLIVEEFSIEQEDEKIARQINDILTKENSSKNDEELLTALTEKLLKDEKRRRKIIKEILKLQRKKR